MVVTALTYIYLEPRYHVTLFYLHINHWVFKNRIPTKSSLCCLTVEANIYYSQPLDKYSSFYRRLRFFYPACCLSLGSISCLKMSIICLIYQMLVNFSHFICYLPYKFYAEYEIDNQ